MGAPYMWPDIAEISLFPRRCSKIRNLKSSRQPTPHQQAKYKNPLSRRYTTVLGRSEDAAVFAMMEYVGVLDRANPARMTICSQADLRIGE